MKDKILICGHRSFVAKGLVDLFKKESYQVDCFTRGIEARTENIITGDVKQIERNPFFDTEYDIVINFILLKDCSIDENIEYVNALLNFCKQKKVKQLIHISSIMAYNEELPYIDESTHAELDIHKQGYAALKNTIDKHIEESKTGKLTVSFVRPGFVATEQNRTPYLIKLPFNIAVIKGSRQSILPIVMRNDIHQALINMIKLGSMEKVYLFLPSTNETKYQYAKHYYKGIIIGLPESLIRVMASMAKSCRILNQFQYNRIKGMFKKTHYNSSKTESELHIKF